MARNEKFQQLVKDVALATLAHRQKKGQAGYVKVRVHEERQMSAALNLLPLRHSALIHRVSFSEEFSVKRRFKQTESGWRSFAC